MHSGLVFYDYVCTNRETLSGDIVEEKMVLNDVGKIIKKLWLKIPELRAYFELDEIIAVQIIFMG